MHSNEHGSFVDVGPAVLSTGAGSPTSASFTGNSQGGSGNDYGPGGNAHSGNAGPSNGGYIYNAGGDVSNTASSTCSSLTYTGYRLTYVLQIIDTAPNGGDSGSGNASGGDVRARNFRRATDDQTAGGNAYTGNTGNVNGGEIYNEADDDSTITNTGGSK